MTMFRVHVSGTKGSRDVEMLLDTGATYSFVRRDIAEALGEIQQLPTPRDIVIADGNVLSITDVARLTIQFGKRVLEAACLVLEHGRNVVPLLLGESTLQQYGIIINYRDGLIAALVDQQQSYTLCPIQPTPNPINVPNDNTVGAGFKPAPTEKETLMMNESYARVFGLLQWQINDALTDDDAVKMIVDAVKGRYMVASEPILAALKLDKSAQEPEVLGSILALQHPGNVVPLAEHQAVQSELLTLKSAKLINDAIGVEGKLAPSQKAWAEEILATHGYDVLAAALEKMPRTIPVGLKPPEGPTKEQQQSAAAAQGLDDVQRTINRQMGISDEIFLKYNP